MVAASASSAMSEVFRIRGSSPLVCHVSSLSPLVRVRARGLGICSQSQCFRHRCRHGSSLPVKYQRRFPHCSLQTDRPTNEMDNVLANFQSRSLPSSAARNSVTHKDLEGPQNGPLNDPHQQVYIRVFPDESSDSGEETEDAPSALAIEQQSAEGVSPGVAVGGSIAFGALVVAAILAIALTGYLYRDDIAGWIQYFSNYVEEAGPFGYLAFTLGYAALEILAIPAIPLTMSAGVLFGPVVGTLLCSASGTISATVAFLIARYIARDRVLELVKGNKKYEAIDRAVAEDSFRIVTLLRLSPLLPFSLGNYIYGLTSVKLVPYVFGSWIGMLPGTWAYVSAGSFGRSLLEAEDGKSLLSDSSLWSLVVGLAVTAFAATYITNVARNAIKDVE